MKSLMYIVLKSPFVSDVQETIETLSGESEKAVLLFEDGIYYATHSEKRKKLIESNIKIFAISDDLQARGYADFSDPGVEVMDYGAAIELIMEKYDSVITI